MDKHPTCVITVLIVDRLGPNTLCAIPWLSIYFTVLFVHVLFLSFFSSKRFWFFFFGMIEILLSSSGTLAPRPPVLCVQSECRAYKLQAIELIIRSTVLKAACVAVKSPISSYFTHLLASESVSVLPAQTCWPVGVTLSWMYIFICVWMRYIFFSLFPVSVWLFVFSISVSIVTISVFSPPPFPSPLLQTTNSPFPPPAAVSLSQNHLLLWLLLFSRMAFLFLLLSLFFYSNNYYYCKVYLEETIVYITITILS